MKRAERMRPDRDGFSLVENESSSDGFEIFRQ